MSKVEVLVACMHQTDDSLYIKMNLQTDAILANQTDDFFYKEYQELNNNVVKLISTNDRGVGKNRNKALMFATGEYLLFADEDVVYVDRYEKIILDAFKKKVDADMFIFNLNILGRDRESVKYFKRLRFWNAMRYGAPTICIKKTALEKANLHFSHLYGGGAMFSCGEDSLFIRECFRKGLRIYYCPNVIATVKQEDSTWFVGYNEKYFIDKGVLISNMFPVLKYILVYAWAYRMRNLNTAFNYWRVVNLLKKGLKEFNRI